MAGEGWEGLEDDGRRPPVPLGEGLDRTLRALGLPAAAAVGAVFGRWEEMVGERVAAHATPVSLDGGRLVVAVDEPGWATQLRYLEADLVRRVAAVAGEGVVTRIDVRVRPRGPDRP
jgi:predicted nucleic acid-binding Zn ribbon protein